MRSVREYATQIAADAVDIGYAALAAAWPRSSASREVERLTQHGYVPGATYEMDFSLSFDETGAETALDAIRSAGFTVTERTRSTLCYATARRQIALKAFDLHRATAVLQRIVDPYFGFAAPIGPIARVYVPPVAAEREAARIDARSGHTARDDGNVAAATRSRPGMMKSMKNGFNPPSARAHTPNAT